MVFTVIRDAFDLERNLMAVCPEWDLACTCALHVRDHQ
jgi:hypothetical protein